MDTITNRTKQVSLVVIVSRSVHGFNYQAINYEDYFFGF